MCHIGNRTLAYQPATRPPHHGGHQMDSIPSQVVSKRSLIVIRPIVFPLSLYLSHVLFTKARGVHGVMYPLLILGLGQTRWGLPWTTYITTVLTLYHHEKTIYYEVCLFRVIIRAATFYTLPIDCMEFMVLFRGVPVEFLGGVLGTSQPLANTGVSGRLAEVCNWPRPPDVSRFWRCNVRRRAPLAPMSEKVTKTLVSKSIYQGNTKLFSLDHIFYNSNSYA